MSALFGTLWSMPGGGAATTDGLGIDQSSAITGATLIFDLQGISRPVAANIVVGTGDLIDMATSTDPNALLDGDHASWQEVRAASGFSVIEMITAAGVAGVRIRRTSGSSSGSSVRVYAPQRGPGYNPVYDPNYDVAFAGENDARRFIDQATMGPTYGQAQTLAAGADTIGDWMDAQKLLTASSVQSTWPNVGNQTDSVYPQTTSGMLETFCQSSAQLRLRMGFVLGQIVVAGMAPGSANPNAISWWNELFAVSLGNFREVLRLSWMHRHMGKFLNNHANNAKNDQPPSQNYARELVQLFSMGLFMLNKDGSRVLGSDGQPVASYGQQDVNAIARLSCGWGLPFPYSQRPGEEGTPANGWMMSYASVWAYNTAPLTLFGYDSTDYPSFGTVASPTEQTLIDRREAVLDIIMAHQSTGPYICKQIIQKLVTDNPSPQYIRRVVAAWDNNGSGVVGDLFHVARAALLDVEARGNSKPASFGRVPDPALTITRRMRYAAAAANDVGRPEAMMWTMHYGGNENVVRNIGQWLGVPVSVFNDYPFQYKLGDIEAPATATWGAQSFLSNFSVAMSISNSLANPTAPAQWDVSGRWNATGLVALYDATAGTAADKAAAVIDRAYADLHQGAAPSTAERDEILALMDTFNTQAITTRARCIWLTQFLQCVPRAAVVV